jgi:hypothetical protein
MLRRRYEILLPLTFNDGRPIPGDAFEQTREELVAQFSGVTLLPGSNRGIWVHEGVRYEDESIRLIVDVDDIPEIRAFFTAYKPTLLKRFEQLEIYIVSFLIDVI